MRPIRRCAQGGCGWRGLFVLDLDEIHIGCAKEGQVLIDRRLALVEGGIEMHKEGRWNIGRWGCGVDQIEDRIAFVHWSRSSEQLSIHVRPR